MIAFPELAQRHRRALHVHCYRMVGSFTEADDLVQETLLRAWRARASFDENDGEAGLRRWLYKIATNACLDHLRSSTRKVTSYHSFAEIPWQRGAGPRGTARVSCDVFTPRGEPFPGDPRRRSL